MKFDKRHFRWFWQRRTRGFDDRELWSLDYTILKFILPRLKAFRKDVYGWPELEEIPTFEDWQKALDKMIEAMQIVVEQRDYPFDWSLNGRVMDEREKKETEDHKKVEEGLQLFFDYFRNLWY